MLMPDVESRGPMVSVVIPVYNGARYLAEAIDSALGQTYPNKEVIVVNDGSTDGGATDIVARGYGDRITYLTKENGGVSTALNLGVERSSGAFISWLSHDDAYPLDKVQRQVEFLRTLGDRAEDVIPYGGVQYMDARSIVYQDYDLPDVPPGRLYEALLCEAVFLSPLRRMRFGINGCTALIPREAFRKVGMFDPALRTTQDFDMWFRMNHHYDFVQMDGHLLRSRQHPEQGYRILRNHVVVEVNRLFDRALGLYRPGSDKWDLDLPKVALAMKMNPLKRDAARKAMEMATEADKDVLGLVYYMMARMWIPPFKAAYELTDRM